MPLLTWRTPRLDPLVLQYLNRVWDAWSHGEFDIISYSAYRRLVQQQKRLQATDPGGDVKL